MAHAIPASLLIHSVMHKFGAVTKNEWSAESWASEQVLRRVRIESARALVRNAQNEEAQAALVLFYDAINSRPLGVEFKLGDAIAIGSDTHKVVFAEPIYDSGKLHHWEVGLA